MSRISGKCNEQALYIAQFLIKNKDCCVTLMSMNKKSADRQVKLIKEKHKDLIEDDIQN